MPPTAHDDSAESARPTLLQCGRKPVSPAVSTVRRYRGITVVRMLLFLFLLYRPQPQPTAITVLGEGRLKCAEDFHVRENRARNAPMVQKPARSIMAAGAPVRRWMSVSGSSEQCQSLIGTSAEAVRWYKLYQCWLDKGRNQRSPFIFRLPKNTSFGTAAATKDASFVAAPELVIPIFATLRPPDYQQLLSNAVQVYGPGNITMTTCTGTIDKWLHC